MKGLLITPSTRHGCKVPKPEDKASKEPHGRGLLKAEGQPRGICSERASYPASCGPSAIIETPQNLSQVRLTLELDQQTLTDTAVPPRTPQDLPAISIKPATMRFFQPLLVLLPLAAAQAPFQIEQSSYPTAALATVTSVRNSYEASLSAQPAYTSLFNELCSISVELPAVTVFAEAGCDPIALAGSFLRATATPFWYSDLPNNLQGYVSSVANAEASMLAKAVNGGERVSGSVKVTGMVLAAGVAVMLML